jgi:hypothetical protein
MRVEQRELRSAPEVASWRRRQLIEAGFSPSLARRVANDAAYDVHALIELVERGCPPTLAVRIRAPLDARPGV